MKTKTLTAQQTSGLAQALRTSIKAKQAPAKTFEATIRRIVHRATKPTEGEHPLHAVAKRLNMRCLAIGKTTVAFAQMEGEETFEIYLYQRDEQYLARGAFTPGRCIAKLQRQDMPSATFEALATRLVS